MSFEDYSEFMDGNSVNERSRNWLEHLQALAAPALELIYPPVCVICEQRETEGSELVCENCWRDLRGQIKEAESGRDMNTAPQLDSQSSGLIPLFSLGGYSPPLSILIQRLKYGGYTRLAPELGRLLLKLHSKSIVRLKIDCLLAVPLHINTHKKRGFNQAEVLADILSRELGLPFAPKGVLKVSATRDQTRLTPQRRGENLTGAFAVGPDSICNRRVLLVDDVSTTGATIREVSKAVKRGGGEVVGGVVLAAALNQIQLANECEDNQW